MDTKPVLGTASDEDGKKFFIYFTQQWGGIFRPATCAWVDFTFIYARIEFAKYSGRVEAEFALLGFAAVLTYVYDNAFNKRMKARVDELLADKPTESPSIGVE